MLGVMVIFAQTTTTGKIAVGAVRWDAWYGPEGPVGAAVTNDLSPVRYHDRLPFFATIGPYNKTTNSTITLYGNTTEVMSQEIDYAAKFGIDFWAFCAYPVRCKDYNPPASECPKIQCCADNYMLSYALEQYLTNENNHRVNFSLILQCNNWYPSASHGGSETIAEEADRFVSYFKMPNFQRALGRPVVYLFGGHSEDAASALKLLSSKTHQALGITPYFVDMRGELPSTYGADAVSKYVTTGGGNQEGAPYETSIQKPEEAFWAAVAAKGGKLIPPISPGWNPSPREYIDLPWGDQGHTRCVIKLGHPCYVQDPTMQQLEDHTAAAVRFAINNPKTVEAQAVIIGAWNENDEGHWIMPSLLNGTQKLQAVQRGIRRGHNSP